MSLVKWIRKHQSRLMTWVLIFAVIAFVGGYALQQILSQLSMRKQQSLARYGGEYKVMSKDIIQAQTELNVLQSLYMHQLLRMNPSIIPQRPDFKSLFLSQVLFPQSENAGRLSVQLKRFTQGGMLMVSDDEIQAFLEETASQNPDLMWLLLKREAQMAGIAVTGGQAKQFLVQVIPQMTQMDTAVLIGQVMENYHLTEEQLYQIVSELLSVLTYAEIVNSNESFTINDLKASAIFRNEKIDAEFIKLSSDLFAQQVASPTNDELQKHFNSYKDIPAGKVTQSNPYGFGYQLPDRVKLEYIIISLDDVEQLIEPVMPEEAEEYYRNNINFFKYDEKVDPNDPQSETVTVTRSYAEVASTIRRILRQERTRSRATMILNDFKKFTDVGFKGIYLDQAKTEEIRNRAGDFAAAAEKISKKYTLSVHHGKTSLLSMDDFAADSYLRSMSMEGQSGIVQLSKIVFAVDEVQATQLARYELTTPRMWETIGPVRGFSVGTKDNSEIRALVRVIEVQPAQAPDRMDYTVTKKGIVLDSDKQADAETYSVLETVVKDYKSLEAMANAMQRAQDLVAMVSNSGWDEAISSFNEKYSTAVKIDSLQSQMRTSQKDMIRAGKMLNAEMVSVRKQQKELIDHFYSLLPSGMRNIQDARKIFEFKPNKSAYVVKSVSKTPVNETSYTSMKGQTAMYLEMENADSMALKHLMPSNIIKRMKFERINRDEPSQEQTDGDQ